MLIWNYKDRVGVPNGEFDATGIDSKNLLALDSSNDKTVTPMIISTLSCVSLQTQKAKNRPDGSFRAVLAPFKNWVSTLTPGSWCVILMGNEPITQKDFKKANKDKVKMFGRIESVRCETKVDANGTRQTLYYVTGTDWGDIFNSVLYVDNLIKGPNDKGNDQGDIAAIAIRKLIFNKDGLLNIAPTRDNLRGIIDIMGKDLSENTADKKEIGRLANAVYEFKLPNAVAEYFSFKNSENKPISGKGESLTKVIALKTGWLTDKDKYSNLSEAEGVINPFSLQGTNSLWQILLENSNHALNEMLCDFRWNSDSSVQFSVYNRIKPFSYKKYKAKAGVNGAIGSYFQNIKYHDLKNNEVISINAGTNWRDKINFIELKPQFQDFKILENMTKQKVQAFDKNSFQREGFRSLILETKQIPFKIRANSEKQLSYDNIAYEEMQKWVLMMREWYFGTHRMLNGTLVIHGISNYISVGDNVRFSSGLINPTTNMSKDILAHGHTHVLAHVESVQHDFNVGNNGARSYVTTIQFVRGITVNDSNELVGDGILDQNVTSVSTAQDRNTLNTVSTSDEMSDPDSQKIRGN